MYAGVLQEEEDLPEVHVLREPGRFRLCEMNGHWQKYMGKGLESQKYIKEKMREIIQGIKEERIKGR